MKRQRRVTKEAPQQLGVSSQSASFPADVGSDLVDSVRGQICEAPVLQVAPQELNGVEIGRVGRKPHDVAARMSRQPFLHEVMLVRASAIPHDDQRAAHVTQEMTEKAQDLRPANVEPRVEGQGEDELTPASDTIRAPIPETFSCARARTTS